MPNKSQITDQLIELLGQSKNIDLETALKSWWTNIRRNGGMRLTAAGYEIMHDVLKLESWRLDLVEEPRQILTKRLILDLDRKLEWPYYIEVNIRKKVRHIVFFSSREAMMATMYDDLEQWLRSLG